MNAPIRKVYSYSKDPAALAVQVGQLARDLYARTRYEFSEVRCSGVVTFGKKWRLDVGREKPLAVVAIDVQDTTNRTAILPGAVQWQWVNGQAQIDDMWSPFSADTEYLVTFLVIHRRT